jgi:predicted Holliday junction resolvase-like endonuclease
MDYFMVLWILIIGVLIGLLIGMVISYRTIAIPLKKEKEKIEEKKRRMSSLYGKITEQFAPFMKKYPYNPNRFRFIGSPIDGIQFEKDEIIFVEFKTATSKLTQEQKRIRQLVIEKKIEWLSFELKWE